MPSDAAVADAVATGAPLLAAALQDAPGNMAGEGKLLNIYWLLRRSIDLGVGGAVVELGCHRGVTAALLQSVLAAHRADWDPRNLHVYDSFEGLPVGSSFDPPAYGTPGAMAATPDDVRATFAALKLPPPTIHKGWFADFSGAEVPDRVAFAHVDGDLYESIADALALVYRRGADIPQTSRGAAAAFDVDIPWRQNTNAFRRYPRLARGAIVVVDDVSSPELPRHELFPGALAAVEDFLADKPEALQPLPAPHPTIDAIGGFGGYETHGWFQKK